jgi:hypothetical protein
VVGLLAAVTTATLTAGSTAGAAPQQALAPAVSVGASFTANASSVPRHPRHNLAPAPDYVDVCVTKGYNDPACIKRALAAIRHARSREHMKKRAMILPRNYSGLTVAEQTFVITDLERVDRGLKPFAGLSATLNKTAKVAATLHLDPTLATASIKSLHVVAYGSNWAGDFGPLSSDYDWMYNDGYGAQGINLACLTKSSEGCWGHRSNILWPYPETSRLVAGAGTATPAGASIAEILTAQSGKAPKYTYTWQAALRHGADGHRVKPRH